MGEVQAVLLLGHGNGRTCDRWMRPDSLVQYQVALAHLHRVHQTGRVDLHRRSRAWRHAIYNTATAWLVEVMRVPVGVHSGIDVLHTLQRSGVSRVVIADSDVRYEHGVEQRGESSLPTFEPFELIRWLRAHRQRPPAELAVPLDVARDMFRPRAVYDALSERIGGQIKVPIKREEVRFYYSALFMRAAMEWCPDVPTELFLETEARIMAACKDKGRE